MNTSPEIGQIAAALAAAQADMLPVPKTKTAQLGANRPAYHYADIADVLATVLKTLSKQKLAVVQATVLAEGVMLLRTRIMHASGEWIESLYPVCSIDGNHQRMGSALTYSRRYALSSLIGVATEDDDDGASAEAPRGPVLAKKSNGGKTYAEVKGGAISSGKEEPTMAQRALDNFNGYMVVVERAYERCATIDDLNAKSDHYDTIEVRDAILPPDIDRLVAAYERAERRISGER